MTVTVESAICWYSRTRSRSVLLSVCLVPSLVSEDREKLEEAGQEAEEKELDEIAVERGNDCPGATFGERDSLFMDEGSKDEVALHIAEVRRCVGVRLVGSCGE